MKMSGILQPEDSKRVADAMIAAMKTTLPDAVRYAVGKALEVASPYGETTELGRILRQAVTEVVSRIQIKGGGQ